MCEYSLEVSDASNEASDSEHDDESSGFATPPGSEHSNSMAMDTACGFSPVSNKPHKSQDAGWEAIKRLAARDDGVRLSHFRLLQRLGSGDIGSVFLTELRGTDCYFAMKVMDKKALASRNKLHRAHTEKEILEMLDHPFLPTLYAYIDDGHHACLVMEFCPGGDLHVLRQLQQTKRFSDNAVRFYAAEVLLALEYLHMMGVVYRDLKPENVLVREDGHIMLSDFDLSLKCTVNPTLTRVAVIEATGWASPPPPTRSAGGLCNPSSGSTSCIAPLGCVSPCNIHPIASCLPIPRLLSLQRSCGSGDKPPRHHGGRGRRRRSCQEGDGGERPPLPELLAEPTSVRSMSFVGTHEYLAPEIILAEGHGSAVDWWTYGIFLYELLYGRTPYKGQDNEATLTNVVTQLLRFPAAAGDGREAGAAAPAAAQDLIRGLLVKDPQKRLGAVRGASEIKQHPFFQGVNWALIRCAVPPEVPSPYAAGLAEGASASSGDSRNRGPYCWFSDSPSDTPPDFEFF